MAALEVLLFGGFQLRRDGEPLAADPVPGRAVAARPPRRQPWGPPPPGAARVAVLARAADPSRARRRLSHTLWQIQDALERGVDRSRTSSGRGRHARRSGPTRRCWVDVEEFERGLDRLRARRSDARAADLAELEAAVELYRGDFLAGHYDELGRWTSSSGSSSATSTRSPGSSSWRAPRVPTTRR